MILDRIRTFTLSNGLTAICCNKLGAPVVSVQVWYRVGSVNENNGIRGISHVLEHMMFRGSRNVASEEHARKIADVGGHCNAFTSEDATGYINSVPRDYLDLVLTLEADRMQELLLDPSLFEKERTVILEEYHGHMNNPVEKAFLEFRETFFGTHPYAVAPLGRVEDLQKLSVDDCRDYYGHWYCPSRATVVVVGELDDDDSALGMIEKRFGKIGRRGAEIAIGPIPPPKPATGWMRRRVEFDVPLLIAGFPCAASTDPDAVALDVLQIILSHGETSRLYRALVRKRSLAVMAGGFNHTLRSAGMTMFFAAFTPDVSSHSIEKAINREIASVLNDGITSDEMEKVKNSVLTNRMFELESVENICQRIASAQVIEGDYRRWIDRLSVLEKLTVDELVASARKYWNDSGKLVLLLKPKKFKLLPAAFGLLRRCMPH